MRPWADNTQSLVPLLAEGAPPSFSGDVCSLLCIIAGFFLSSLIPWIRKLSSEEAFSKELLELWGWEVIWFPYRFLGAATEAVAWVKLWELRLPAAGTEKSACGVVC